MNEMCDFCGGIYPQKKTKKISHKRIKAATKNGFVPWGFIYLSRIMKGNNPLKCWYELVSSFDEYKVDNWILCELCYKEICTKGNSPTTRKCEICEEEYLLTEMKTMPLKKIKSVISSGFVPPECILFPSSMEVSNTSKLWSAISLSEKHNINRWLLCKDCYRKIGKCKNLLIKFSKN